MEDKEQPQENQVLTAEQPEDAYTSKPLEDSYLIKLREWFPLLVFSHEYTPGKFVAPEKFLEIGKDVRNLKVYPDDVWVVSYPRTGSTWCQEIVWLLMNDFKYEEATNTIQQKRAPPIEYQAYRPSTASDSPPLDHVKDLKRPRCIKSHCPYDWLPKDMKTVKAKIIYTIRNPKDVYCSYYFFMQTFHKMQAKFVDAAKLFVKGKLPIGDYFDHLMPFWKRRDEPNVLVLKYEDMLKDTRKVIKQIADFLEKPITDPQLEKLHEFVKFDNLKNNPGFNLEKLNDFKGEGLEPFVRKGQVGDWKGRMPRHISLMFEDWTYKRTEDTTLTFEYE